MPGFVKRTFAIQIQMKKKTKIIKTKGVIVLSIIEFSLFFYNVDTANNRI